MATISKGKTFTSGETVTPTKLNDLVDNATIAFVTADDTDDSTLETSAGKLRAKDAGITAAKLADGAVTGAAGGGKVAASAITGQTQLADPLAAGDEFLVHDTSASALRRVAWSALQPAGTVVNTDYVEAVGVQTFTSNFIATNVSAPAVTDGNEVLSKAFATSSASNYVLLQASVHVGSTQSNALVMLFAGSTLIASRASAVATYIAPMTFIIKYTPPSTASVTYSVRIATPSGTLYLNRGFSTDPYPTSVRKSSLLIQEIKA